MATLITGYPGTTLTRVGRSWGGSSWQTTKYYRGPCEACEGAIPDIMRRRQGETHANIDPDESGPFATLVVVHGNAQDGSKEEDQVLPVWSLLGNDIEKDIRFHFKCTALEKAKAGVVNTIYMDAVNARNDTKSSAKTSPIYFDKQPASQSLAAAFYATVLAGYDFFSYSQFVLQRTMVVAQGSQIKTGINFVGQQYTSNQLIDQENVPADITADMPGGFWLKRTPTREQMADGRVTITQQWWHSESYSSFIYDPLT